MAETGNQRNLTKGEKTKYRLARAMKECMGSTSVENITVKQITEQCGLTRQTFYRNFLDKYDLINWYFDKLLVKSFEHMGQGKTVYDALVKKFTYMLPIVMEYNQECTGEKYREIARAMGVKDVDSMTQEEYRKAAIDAVRKLSVDVGIPTKLEAIKEEDLQFLAESAHADACAPWDGCLMRI